MGTLKLSSGKLRKYYQCSFIFNGLHTVYSDIFSSLIEISEYFWHQNKPNHVRNLLDFTLGHHTLQQSSNKREWEFADMWAIDMNNEGPTPCTALVIVMRHGKTNQNNRVEYVAVMRNRVWKLHTAYMIDNAGMCVNIECMQDVATCSIGALGFYLFDR